MIICDYYTISHPSYLLSSVINILDELDKCLSDIESILLISSKNYRSIISDLSGQQSLLKCYSERTLCVVKLGKIIFLQSNIICQILTKNNSCVSY